MSQGYMGELRLAAFPFAPKNWALCNGQLLAIAQNQALFSLLGTTYGGDGRVRFGLPDLRSRVPTHWGQARSGYTYSLGEMAGTPEVTLLQSQLPQHSHFLNAHTTTAATANTHVPAAGLALGQSIGTPAQGANFAVNVYESTATPNTVMAPSTVGVAGSTQPHNNLQPYLVLNWIICLFGVFPSRD